MTVPDLIDPVSIFHGEHYMRHNQRRQEHLASLQLDLANRTVLEVGAGIGDHTSFFVDRGCRVTVTEARAENLSLIKQRFPSLEVEQLDLDSPDPGFVKKFDVVYCYGTLYHLSEPERALDFMATRCAEILLLETCVSFRDNGEINLCTEKSFDPSQARSGTGCRPGRSWIFNKLKSSFQYVYMPTTQPWHEEFPIDWSTSAPENMNSLWRAVFIASRYPIVNDLLVESIPLQQQRL